MKINRYAFSSFFALIFLLYLVGCLPEATLPEPALPEPTEGKLTPKEEGTTIAARYVPTAESSSNPDSYDELPNSSSAGESSEETTDGNTSEEQTTDVVKTGGAPTPDDETSESTDGSNDNERVAISSTATPTPEPNVTPSVRPSVTPKIRDNWRAISGEFEVHYTNGIKEFQYWFILPKIWTDVFEARQENETFLHVMYKDQEVFVIQALKEDEWEANKAKGEAGIEITRMRGVVIEYDVIRENPYKGEEAELFQELIDSVPEVLESLEIESRQASY